MDYDIELQWVQIIPISCKLPVTLLDMPDSSLASLSSFSWSYMGVRAAAHPWANSGGIFSPPILCHIEL